MPSKKVDYTSSYGPPGRVLQFINTVIHLPFVLPFVYYAVWSLYTCIISPILGMAFLPLNLVFNLWKAISNSVGKLPESKELGVVITGCDTGFGNLLALHLAKT